MSAASPRTQDPSMEEILASIRRIIADDQGGAEAGAQPADETDDVLDLAELAPAPAPPPAPAPAPVSRPTLVADAEAFRDFQPEPEAPPRPSIVASPARMPARSALELEPEPSPLAAMRPSFSDFDPAPEPEAFPVTAPSFAAAPPPVMAPPAALPPAAPAFTPAPSAPTASESLEALVSSEATSSVGNAFSMLSHTVLTQNARTLEDLVKDMLKPMLKAWLDDNLPPLVERLVRAEIERVARGGR
jgi:cell pole-organizing protein PopZ